MTVQQAFSILNIGPSSDEEQVKQAFHELSLIHHPDVSGQTTDEKQQHLNEAYKVALKALKNKQVVKLPAIIDNSLKQVTLTILRTEFREETRSYVKKITKHKLNRSKPIAYTLWAFAAVAGLLGFVGKEIIPEFALSKTTLESAKIVTVVIGAYALIFQFMRDNLSNRIERLSEDYNDKRIVAFELSKLLKFQAVKVFDFSKLLNSKEGDFQSIRIAILGSVSAYERTKLLILKAKEIGLIEPNQPDFVNPDTIDKYNLKFNPADFGIYEEPEPPKARTADEIKSEIKNSIITGAIFLIGTGLIIFFYKSLWSILTGVITLAAFASIVTLKQELKAITM
jgi:hypothetical protein